MPLAYSPITAAIFPAYADNLNEIHGKPVPI
jgi:hypothetical protein